MTKSGSEVFVGTSSWRRSADCSSSSSNSDVLTAFGLKAGSVEDCCKKSASVVHYDPLSLRLAVERFSPTGGSSGSNSKAFELAEIYKAIYSMSVLPEVHPFHLEETVATAARDVLAYLVQNSNIPLPQLINRGGDALSFTWPLEKGKSYLTVDDGGVDLFSILPEGMEIEEDLSINGHLDASKLLMLISESLNATVSR